MERLEHSETAGRTITLKIKFSDFRQITRSKTVQHYIRDFDTLHREVTALRKSIKLENPGSGFWEFQLPILRLMNVKTGSFIYLMIRI